MVATFLKCARCYDYKQHNDVKRQTIRDRAFIELIQFNLCQIKMIVKWLRIVSMTRNRRTMNIANRQMPVSECAALVYAVLFAVCGYVATQEKLPFRVLVLCTDQSKTNHMRNWKFPASTSNTIYIIRTKFIHQQPAGVHFSVKYESKLHVRFLSPHGSDRVIGEDDCTVYRALCASEAQRNDALDGKNASRKLGRLLQFTLTLHSISCPTRHGTDTVAGNGQWIGGPG